MARNNGGQGFARGAVYHGQGFARLTGIGQRRDNNGARLATGNGAQVLPRKRKRRASLISRDWRAVLRVTITD
jgi:hypothetical protein